MHWHQYNTCQHNSLANFYITYKSSWEYSQAWQNDCLQGLVARPVPGILWLGPATRFWPGPGHSWGVNTEETIPSSWGKGYEWVCVTCTHSLGDSFPAGSAKHQEPWDTSWATCHAALVWACFGGQQVCKQNYVPENGLDHFWFTNIVIASVYSFPLSDEGGWSGSTWFSISAPCCIWLGKL